MKQDRMARVNRLLQTTLAEMIPACKDPRVRRVAILAITGVEASPDLHHAKVFLAISGTEEEREGALSGLKGASKFLRSRLGAEVSLRYTPELHFELDRTQDSAARIENILMELASERAEREGAEEAGEGGAPSQEQEEEDEHRQA